jgi:Protein of unknown function (DUF3592)
MNPVLKGVLTAATVLLFLSFAFVPSTLWAVQLHQRASRFTLTTGQITAKSMHISTRRRNREKSCAFAYSYTVNGQGYTGQQLSLDSDDNKYDFMFWALPRCPHFNQVGGVGQPLSVRYNAARPEESLIVNALPFKRLLNVLLLGLAWVGWAFFSLSAWRRL